MARPLWTGALSFGLVTIPVTLHTAVRDRGPKFHLLRRRDKSRIKYKRVAEKGGEVVEWDDIVKGYEYEKGRWIVLTQEDFDKAAVGQNRTVDILDFVKGEEVDDRYFDKPYYVLPGKGGVKAYTLLRDVIADTRRIGIAKFVMRTKQYLAAVEAIGDALVLSTLRFREDLVRLEEYDFPRGARARAQDLKLARMLVDEFSSEWDPDKYTDDYRQNLMEVIEAKRKRQEPDLEEPEVAGSARVIDLMERLQKSLGTAPARRRVADKAGAPAGRRAKRRASKRSSSRKSSTRGSRRSTKRARGTAGAKRKAA